MNATHDHRQRVCCATRTQKEEALEHTWPRRVITLPDEFKSACSRKGRAVGFDRADWWPGSEFELPTPGIAITSALAVGAGAVRSEKIDGSRREQQITYQQSWNGCLDLY